MKVVRLEEDISTTSH